MKTSGILLLALLSTSAFAHNKSSGRLMQPEFSSAPHCQGRPEFLTEMRNEFPGNLSHLPETVLVAREAEFYVDGGNDLKLYGYQSFLKKGPGSSQVLCGSQSSEGRERFSLLAPTLIDTHKKSKVGQSLWQFQMVTDGGKYSFWNMKSPSLGPMEALEQWAKSAGASYKIYQKSHSEYELLMVKNEKGIAQYLSITYDAVPKLK
ncbi:MAG: hypothetical protein ACM3MG_12230 [Bacillota bacterium]